MTFGTAHLDLFGDITGYLNGSKHTKAMHGFWFTWICFGTFDQRLRRKIGHERFAEVVKNQAYMRRKFNHRRMDIGKLCTATTSNFVSNLPVAQFAPQARPIFDISTSDGMEKRRRRFSFLIFLWNLRRRLARFKVISV